MSRCSHCVLYTYSFYWCTGRYNYYAFWNENKEIGKASLEPQLQYLPKSKNVRICCKMKDFQVPFKLLESSNNLRVLKIFKVLVLFHLFGVPQGNQPFFTKIACEINVFKFTNVRKIINSFVHNSMHIGVYVHDVEFSGFFVTQILGGALNFDNLINFCLQKV